MVQFAYRSSLLPLNVDTESGQVTLGSSLDQLRICCSGMSWQFELTRAWSGKAPNSCEKKPKSQAVTVCDERRCWQVGSLLKHRPSSRA